MRTEFIWLGTESSKRRGISWRAERR